MDDTPGQSKSSYPKFPDARGVSSRAEISPIPEPPRPRPNPSAKSKQLIGVELAVCILLPPVGFILGLIRVVRGDPTGRRLLLISGFMLLLLYPIRSCIRSSFPNWLKIASLDY